MGLPQRCSSLPHMGSCSNTGPVPCVHVYMHTPYTHVHAAHASKHIPTCTHSLHTQVQAHVCTSMHMHKHTLTCALTHMALTLLSPLYALTLSLGSRLMVFRGRRTRRTRRDLMVLISFPLDPLGGEATCRQAGGTSVPPIPKKLPGWGSHSLCVSSRAPGWRT